MTVRGARRAAFHARGWVRLGWDRPDGGLGGKAASGPTMALTQASEGAEFRCDGAWFPGDQYRWPTAQTAARRSLGVPPLGGAPLRFLAEALGFAGLAFDRAQLSVCFPGYPRQGARGDRGRLRLSLASATPPMSTGCGARCRARADGGSRRPTASSSACRWWRPIRPRARSRSGRARTRSCAAPSREAFAGAPPERWREIDVTEAYQEARQRCFETCARVPLPARRGESTIVHRLALHGVAPWTAPANAPPRAIAYFRPDPFPGAAPDWWLTRP